MFHRRYKRAVLQALLAFFLLSGVGSNLPASEKGDAPNEAKEDDEIGICVEPDDTPVDPDSLNKQTTTTSVHFNARVVVGFADSYRDTKWDGSQASAARALFLSYGIEIDDDVSEVLWPYALLVGYLPEYIDGVDPALLTENPGVVEFVFLDQPITWYGEQPPWEGDCPPRTWPLRRARVAQCWGDITGRNVRVAVVDTGVHTHPDLEMRVVFGRSFIPGHGPTVDIVGHGTAMAGIIAARRGSGVGVAPEALIVPVKVDHDGNNADLSRVMAGIVWAANRADDPDGGRAKVINISGGIEYELYQQWDGRARRRWDDILEDVKTRAVLTVASGNRNTHRPSWPAVTGHVLVVGGTGPWEGRWVHRAFVDGVRRTVAGSNYGTAVMGRDHWVHVAAPAGGDQEPPGPGGIIGRGIPCISPPGIDQVEGIGTSPSSAFAAGVVALVLHAEARRQGRELSFAQIRDHLIRTGRPIVLPPIDTPDGRVQPDIGPRIDAFDAVFTEVR